jgi:hypothetical protein
MIHPAKLAGQLRCAALVATTIPGPAGPVQRLSRHAAGCRPARVSRTVPVPRAGPLADDSGLLQEACSPAYLGHPQASNINIVTTNQVGCLRLCSNVPVVSLKGRLHRLSLDMFLLHVV